MKSAFRKTLFLLLLPVTCYLLLVTFASPVHAQCAAPSTPGQTVVDAYNNSAITANVFDDKIFNLNQMSGTVDSMLVLLTGCSEIHPQTNAATQGTGALATSGNMIAALYSNPPVSGVQYLAHQIQKLDPVKPVYAQGIGYNALVPVQDIWTAFRNIAYVGFVIVFIVIGFMIMFRAKVSPQTVATVQDSIPRIIIALILVTFSYAIVGLMIDFMFLLLNVFINALPDSLINRPTANTVLESSIFGVIRSGWESVIGTTASALKSILGTTIAGIGGPLSSIISWGVGGISAVIVGIAALFIMFRIFFMLLMAYVSIIIFTIFAPFLLLFQALPGNNGAMGWLKQIVANLAVFPVAALMIILAGMLGGISEFGGTGTPALSGTQIGQFPLISGGIRADAIGKIIGIGILFMIPSVAGMIKEKLKAGQGVQFGAGAAAIGAGGTALSRPIGAAVNPIYQAGKWKYGEGAASAIGRALPFRKSSGSTEPGAKGTPPHIKDY